MSGVGLGRDTGAIIEARSARFGISTNLQYVYLAQFLSFLKGPALRHEFVFVNVFAPNTVQYSI